MLWKDRDDTQKEKYKSNHKRWQNLKKHAKFWVNNKKINTDQIYARNFSQIPLWNFETSDDVCLHVKCMTKDAQAHYGIKYCHGFWKQSLKYVLSPQKRKILRIWDKLNKILTKYFLSIIFNQICIKEGFVASIYNIQSIYF